MWSPLDWSSIMEPRFSVLPDQLLWATQELIGVSIREREDQNEMAQPTELYIPPPKSACGATSANTGGLAGHTGGHAPASTNLGEATGED